jgi:N-acetylmuramoyl-L-alanine amidase
MQLTRRAVLLGAAAGTAATIAGRPAAAAADPEGIPSTLARLLSADGPTSVDRTEFPLTHLGVAWSESGVAPRVRFRTAEGWQPWQAVTGCSAGRDGGVGAGRGGLVAADGALGYEIADLVGSVKVGELNLVDGPRRLLQIVGEVTATLAGLPLRYRSRAGWGADEDLRFDESGTELWPTEYYPAQTLTVHHTVTRNADPDPAATIRAIYHDHTVVRGFGDIGYHLLIDHRGVVYEGRSSGADPVPVFGGTTSEGRLQMSNGAHVVGFNAGNIGIALLGDFTSTAPTAAAVDSLVQALRVLTAACGLDPTGTTDYVNPISGATATVDTIGGHRDWAAAQTECPGDQLHPMLDSIRRRVAAGGSGPQP